VVEEASSSAGLPFTSVECAATIDAQQTQSKATNPESQLSRGTADLSCGGWCRIETSISCGLEQVRVNLSMV
jgi:hypothetical protein